MPKSQPFALIALTSIACAHHQAAAPQPAPVAQPEPPKPPEIPGHSIDLSSMDRSVSPGSDFFMFANGAWYAKAEIPADRSSTGVWRDVQEQVEKRTSDLLAEAAKSAGPRSQEDRRLLLGLPRRDGDRSERG